MIYTIYLGGRSRGAGSPPPIGTSDMKVEVLEGGPSEPIAEDTFTLPEEPATGGTSLLTEQEPMQSDGKAPPVEHEK
ncbi:UNVERIFIED_CONTAM: hypothetical protein Slati_1488800 [Sesamum latifolium]|uniref:Uncharacterized protein n=1 Tax=Sesamum latifolium TaxID=2727402 RepID=A0AAW2X7Z6_9LAMI